MNPDSVLLRSVLDSLGEGVAVADLQGRLLAFNKTARRFFDPSLMRKPPKNWPKSFGLFLPDAKTPFPMNELPLVRAIRGLNTDPLEMFVRNAQVPAGAWLSLTGRPIRDASGRLLGGVAVFHDITERKKTEHEIVEISGREQRRIGQDLHDGMCQILLAAQCLNQVLEEKIRQDKPSEALGCVQEIREHLSHALAQADVIARGLYPVELEARGLMAALIELAQNYSRIYRVQVRFLKQKPVHVEEAMLATHLYRIAQEAVSNAIKGGRATRVRIQLTVQKRGVRLSITDNGCGISKAIKRKGMGLMLMSYRAQLISARLVFQSMPRGGTKVLCEAPLK